MDTTEQNKLVTVHTQAVATASLRQAGRLSALISGSFLPAYLRHPRHGKFERIPVITEKIKAMEIVESLSSIEAAEEVDLIIE